MMSAREGAVKRFITKLWVITIVCLCLLPAPTKAASAPSFSCASDATGFPLMAPRISGIWYELLRIPIGDVPACVEVFAPKSPNLAGEYVLQVDYVNNVNKQWQKELDVLSFPWNNRTQNGIFDLHYSDGRNSVDITFKLVYTDYKNIMLVCGYSDLARRFSLIKVLTRVRQPNADIISRIEKMADEYGVGEQMTWVDQSSKCNGAAPTLPVLTLLFAGIYGIGKIFGEIL